jgi:hypothetical protein
VQTAANGEHSFESATAGSFTRRHKPVSQWAALPCSVKARHPQMSSTKSKRETVHRRRAKQRRCPPTSPLLHSQALAGCVTQAFLKHSLISTALLELHEISCPSTAPDRLKGARLGQPLRSHWPRELSHTPPCKKHLTERTPKDLDRRCCTLPPSCTETPVTA